MAGDVLWLSDWASILYSYSGTLSDSAPVSPAKYFFHLAWFGTIVIK